jgi:aminopeptidase N
MSWLTHASNSSFESVKGKTKRGIDVAVWTQTGKTELGKYALHCATTILDYYEKAYGVLYPLPKVIFLSYSNVCMLILCKKNRVT